MASKREPILARMAVLLASVAGLTTSGRNSPPPDDVALPAGIQFDGAENTYDADLLPGRPATAPVRVRLTVQWAILAADEPEDVGTDISTLHAAAIKAVLSDATLSGLAGTNGAVRYAGAETYLSEGRQRVSSLMLSFAVTYVLVPAQL